MRSGDWGQARDFANLNERSITRKEYTVESI